MKKNEKTLHRQCKKIWQTSPRSWIDHGTKKTVLKAEESTRVERLIHYFTTDFKAFRKEINADKVDFHGLYANQKHPRLSASDSPIICGMEKRRHLLLQLGEN